MSEDEPLAELERVTESLRVRHVESEAKTLAKAALEFIGVTSSVEGQQKGLLARMTTAENNVVELRKAVSSIQNSTRVQTAAAIAIIIAVVVYLSERPWLRGPDSSLRSEPASAIAEAR